MDVDRVNGHSPEGSQKSASEATACQPEAAAGDVQKSTGEEITK